METPNEALELNVKDELMNELKDHVKLRDSMGSVLWWNVVNDECCVLASKCANLGCDSAKIRRILGQGNFR